MSITSLEKLKSYFKTGAKPTQEQFHALLDSYIHKDEDTSYILQGLAGATFMGVATPDGVPPVPTQKVFYVANEVGTYPNYGGLAVADGEIAFFCYNGSWEKVVAYLEKRRYTNSTHPLANQINKYSWLYLPKEFINYFNYIYIYKIDNSLYVAAHNEGFENRFVFKFINSNNATIKANVYINYSEYEDDTTAYLYSSIPISEYEDYNGLEIELDKNLYNRNFLNFFDLIKTDNIIVGDSISNNSIDINKIGDSLVRSKNLLNKLSKNVIYDAYCSNGVIYADTTFNVSDYIFLKKGKNYICNFSARFVDYYDADFNIISYDNSIKTIVPSENDRYIRLSIYKSDWDDFQIEEGTKSTVYENYQPKLAIPTGVPINPQDTSFFEKKELLNLYNPNKATIGTYYIDTTDGSLSRVYGYGVSDFISIDSKGLIITNGYIAGQTIGHAVYDENKNFIRAYRSRVIDYQEGDAYVRFSLGNTSEIMINRGDTPLPYEPYEEKIVLKADYIPAINSDIEIVHISLPDKLYAVVGDTFQLFYRGCIEMFNPYIYYIRVSCSIGKQYPRYYELTPNSSHIGQHSLKLEVINNNGVIIGESSTTLIVTNKAAQPTQPINIAVFGDSLTAGGTWVSETARRLLASDGTPIGDNLSNINFVGKKKVGDVGFYGVGGWSWNAYIYRGEVRYRFFVENVSTLSVDAVYSNNNCQFTIKEINVTNGNGEISCSISPDAGVPSNEGNLIKISGNGDNSIYFSSTQEDSANPLWDEDNNKMSFIPYANEFCSGRIDVVYTLLTWNAFSAWQTDFTSIIAQAKVFADTLHTEFPNAKLKIMGVQVPSINGGMGASYGATGTSYADSYGMVVSALNLNNAYQDFANEDGYSDYVEFVNVSSQFDSENNMPYINKAVNTRSSLVENIGTNGVHPSTGGYYQIADVAYRNIVATILQ